jgi:Phage integrase, N-terminal SAM-like domain
MTPLRAKYIRDLVIHGRSKHTQEAHTRYLCDLACYYRRSPELISYEEVTGWLYHLITERQLSASSVLRPAPRLMHAFRQNPLGPSGYTAFFVSSAKPGLGYLGVIRAAYIGLMDLLARAQSYFSNLLLRSNPSLPQSALHHSRYFTHT